MGNNLPNCEGPGLGNTIRDDTSRRHRDKYANKNFIHQMTLGRFFDAVAGEIKALAPRRVMEFGCGEGLFLRELKARGVQFPELLGVDLRQDAIDYARTLHPDYRFECVDLFKMDATPGAYDLIICSQVLEHLPRPELFLKRLVEFKPRRLLLTVPWEPWFRLMNLARGRDLRHWGNHPEHINHWGPAAFREFAAAHCPVRSMRTSFPFIILMAGE
jgi:SAM-dependent methyltransferase